MCVRELLIYEEINGKPVYYKDYQQVIKAQKTLDEITAGDSLQMHLIYALQEFLYTRFSRKDYLIACEDVGLYVSKGNRLVNDIVVYTKDKINSDLLSEINLHLPPMIAIEVDIKADLQNFNNPNEYCCQKIKKLLEFGVKKVIWIATKSKKVIIASDTEDWRVVSWYQDVEIWPGHSFSFKKFLDNKTSQATCK